MAIDFQTRVHWSFVTHLNRGVEMETGFLWHEKLMWHDPGSAAAGFVPIDGSFQPGLHVENPETKRKLKNLLDAYDVTPQLRQLDFEPATMEILRRFHTVDYIERVRQLSESRGGDAGDTAPVGPGSELIARMAVGATCAGVASVLKGDVSNSYVLSRPPGHHAERDKGRGFCIYNNIGLAIMEARAKGLVDRVAVVDWDVHHGNGTQQAFYDSPDVLTISLHQEMLYPANMGKLSEQGEGNGEGFNINVPLPAGCGGEAYLAAMEQVVVPALRHFKPELIVVACGYDASYFDPMSHMLLISSHYRQMTEIMMKLSDELCDGRLVVNHEGGYSEFYVPFCGAAVIEAISGIESGIVDPSRATAFVENQLLKPHQQAQIDAAVNGPLQRCLQG